MKKAQAAMETLFTYMKSILVVAIVLAALFAAGVLDAGEILPRKCVGTSGFDCFDEAVATASDDTVEFAVFNNIGAQITLLDTSVGGQAVMSSEGGDCTSMLESVADPDGAGPAVGGDMYMSYGDPPGTPTIYTVENDIPTNALIRIKVKCKNNLESGTRFKDTIIIYYRNELTDLIHKAQVNINTKVN